MTIRPGRSTDLKQIESIEKRVFTEDPWSTATLAEELKLRSDRKTWVIVDENRTMGYAMARYNGCEVHLLNLVVDTPFRSKGCGWKLLKHFLKNIPPKTSVFLEVKEGNFPAINLYQKAGFQQITIRKNYYGDGKNAVIMKKIKY